MTPENILLAMPSYDGRIWTQTMLAVIQVLAASEGKVQPFFQVADSNIAHCRSMIAHYFKTRTQCDTLFCLDTDIVFTPTDFAYMLEGDEQIVIAPYARKIMGMRPTGFGMGFVRIHRSVFEMLDALTDEEGKEALARFYVEGQGIATHYYQTGPSSDAVWMGEDTAFWHLCRFAGVTIRLEKRTRLGHVGQYVYECPNQVPAHLVPYNGPGPYEPTAESDLTGNSPWVA